MFNPIGGPSDDVCPPPFSQSLCLANLKAAHDIPIRDVLAELGLPLHRLSTRAASLDEAFVAGERGVEGWQ